MGGLPCYKAAMDGRDQADATAVKSQATLNQVLNCLRNSASVSPVAAFTEEMEDTMLEASARYARSISAACEDYAKVAAQLEVEVRSRWPAG